MVFTFIVFIVASKSYENINVFQGVDFAMNAAKILEKPLLYAAVYIPGLYFNKLKLHATALSRTY